MDSMGLDYQVVFPTPMLVLGMHPQEDIEAAVGRAYNRWLIERILPQDERIKGLLYLPFNSPRGLRGRCQGLRRRRGRHRLHGHLHAQPARAPRSTT